MDLLQKRSFLFILLFLVLCVVADDPSPVPPPPPTPPPCDKLPGGSYELSALAHCNDAKSLEGENQVVINLDWATQEEIDQLFENKTLLRNVKIKISCQTNPKVKYIEMRNLEKAENLRLHTEGSSLERIIISSPKTIIQLKRVYIESNPNLTDVQFGIIANHSAEKLYAHGNDALREISMKFAEDSSIAIFETVEIYGNKMLSANFIKSFEDAKKERTSRQWRIQPEKECLGENVERDVSILKECKNIYGSVSLQNIKKLNFAGFHIDQITDGYFEVKRTELESISFLVGTKMVNPTDRNEFSGNKYLCNYMDVVDNIQGDKTQFQTSGNCEKCQMKNIPQASFDQLAECDKVVVGDLTFANKVTSMAHPIRLPRIDGCFYIENTDLTTVSFLVGTRTNSTCNDKIIGNPYLCDFVDVVENYPRDKQYLTVQNNCHGCYTNNQHMTNFQILSRCERFIVGNVIMKKNVAPMPRWINLERIDGCFEIDGTDLTTASFLIGTRTRSDCVNVIKNNKYMCDVARVLDNIPEGTYIEAENNCEKVCYDASEVWDKDCEVLHTISDVPISYVKQSKTLKKVHGPIKITSLKTETVDPSVLPQIEYDELVFRGNEFLCDEEAVRKLIPKGKKVSFKQNCWKRCPYPQILYGRKCTVFTGILDHRLFDNIELFERVLQKLEGVEGQIKIFGSYAQNLNFRKLKYVKNDKFPGPAILVENNKILKIIFLENLETVTSKTEPRIRIKNNGNFKFAAKDWQRIRNQTKTRLHKSLVVDIHRTKTKIPEKCSKDDDSSFKVVTPQKGILYWGALTFLVVLCIVIIIIFGLFCWLCYKVETGNI